MTIPERINIRLLNILLATAFLFCPAESAGEGVNGGEEKGTVGVQAAGAAGDTYEENLRRWQSLSEDQRREIRERAKRLTPEQVKELKSAAIKLRTLPKKAQERIKTNYRRFNNLPPEERENLKGRFRSFEKLPLRQKEELRNKLRERPERPAESLDNTQRKLKRQAGKREGVKPEKDLPAAIGQGRRRKDEPRERKNKGLNEHNSDRRKEKKPGSGGGRAHRP
ncbi:MAG: DUF3106 domain-containing protein [Elusimicrobia bacterium]|nr:DUF3106 domain-containing protein [Elusimicrobiota bacterium]